MNKYEINEETLAVIGTGKKSTKVLEKNKEYFLNDVAYEVMDYSCQYFGSSYSGRVEGSKKMIGCNYKLPIIIEESMELIFFPISTPDNPKCVWISLKWFDHVNTENDKTYIYLKNGKKILSSASKKSIENQVLRASRLLYILNERKKPKFR